MGEIDYSFKVTKTKLLNEVCNSMCHNWHYLVYVHIYNKDKTKYKRARFVVWFDALDVEDFFEQNYYTKQNIKEYLNEIICNNMCVIKSFNDTKDFYAMCKESILEYNKTGGW